MIENFNLFFKKGNPLNVSCEAPRGLSTSEILGWEEGIWVLNWMI